MSTDATTTEVPVASWDETAISGETCCKEVEDRRWHEGPRPIQCCGRPASKVIVSDTGERLPFCSYHWAN